MKINSILHTKMYFIYLLFVFVVSFARRLFAFFISWFEAMYEYFEFNISFEIFSNICTSIDKVLFDFIICIQHPQFTVIHRSFVQINGIVKLFTTRYSERYQKNEVIIKFESHDSMNKIIIMIATAQKKNRKIRWNEDVPSVEAEERTISHKFFFINVQKKYTY